jgi:cupin fold WbuC family metalloprotein
VNFKQINEEVLCAISDIVSINKSDIDILKAKALKNERKRIRLCAHRDVQDALHEMVIVQTKDVYIRPHKHINKSESFHIIEGELIVVMFDDVGRILEAIQMGEYLSGSVTYYRLSDDYFHAVVPISDIVVFHEITNGPFNPDNTIYASWAPEENDDEAKNIYMNSISRFLSNHKETGR